MQLPIMESSAPTGVTIQHNGKQYVIEPTALSGKTIKALRRRALEMRSTKAKDLLKTKGLPEAVRDKVIIEEMKPLEVGLQEALKGLQVPEILAEYLSIAADLTYEQAMEIVDEYNDFNALMLLCMQAMGINTLKNSDPPKTIGGDNGLAQDAQQPSGLNPV